MRAREVGRFGNSDIIKLKPHDRQDLNLEYGDLVDIDDIIKIQNKKWKLKDDK